MTTAQVRNTAGPGREHRKRKIPVVEIPVVEGTRKSARIAIGPVEKDRALHGQDIRDGKQLSAGDISSGYMTHGGKGSSAHAALVRSATNP